MGEPLRPTLIPPPSSAPARVDLTKKQLDLVWDMNRDLTPREFDQFIETARALGLSPLSRQVCAMVFNKGQPGRRHMAIVTTIAGLRAIADRSGTYRPDDQPARIVYDDAAKHPRANPYGIVEGMVTPYRFAHGAWHPVVGQVYWDEIAPIREKDGERWLDSRTPWPARPRGQFIKCCEAAALRRGWPENLANVYAEEEVDRARMIDVTPSEAADQAKKERLELVQPSGTIVVDLWDDRGLRAVPQAEFHDVASRHIHDRGREDPGLVLTWAEQQRIALRTFFGLDKAAGLDIARQLEALRAHQKDLEAGKEASHADCA